LPLKRQVQDSSKRSIKCAVFFYCIEDINIPEVAVAYKEEYFIDLLKLYGFEIYKPIQYGSWCGREKYFKILS